MTLEIKNANAAAQLTEIAGVLLQAAADIEATRTAVNAFINSPDLVSRTYDSIRAQYTNLHMPVLQGMLWYIDEMLADQDAYRSQMTTLKGCHLNEAALLTQLSTAKTLDNIAQGGVPMLNSVTRKLVNNIQEKLDSLYTFESSTRGLYGTPQSILPDIRAGIAAIEASVYNPVNHTFSFPPGVSPDMSWRETLNAKWDEKMADGMKILTFEGGRAYANGLNEYTSYSVDPVNLSTGNFIYQKEDLRLFGIIPLSMTRFYNGLSGTRGVLGKGWTHTYEQRLEIREDGLIFHRADGKEETYVKVAAGLYIDGHTGMNTMTLEDDGTGPRYHHQEKNANWYIFDEIGRLLAFGDNNNNQITLIYGKRSDAVKPVSEAAAPTNNCESEVIDRTAPIATDQLQQVQSTGGFLTFTYTEEGNLSSVADHTGRQTTYHYKNDNLVEVIQPGEQTIVYEYDSGGYLISIRNPQGVDTIRNIFDENGRTLRQTFPDGGVMNYQYLDPERKVILTEQNNRQITYAYDERYRTIKIEDSQGEERFAYNDKNQRILSIDRLGRTTHYEYDRQGHVDKIVDPLNNTLEMTYGPHGKLLSLNINNELKLENQYDAKGNHIQSRDALQRNMRFRHNEQGLIIEVIQPDNSTLRFDYDAQGNPIALTDAMGQTTRYEYDTLNRVAKTTDPGGNSTSYFYDSHHNIIKVVNAEGRVRRYTYNKSNKVTSITDFNGGTNSIEYNKLNKPGKFIDALGNVTQLEYDTMWNMVKLTDPYGAEMCWDYNQWNQLKSVTDPLGSNIQYEYDNIGNIIAITNAQGHKHKIAYDALNRPVEMTEPDGAVTAYDYNAEGRITQITDALGNKTQYRYDAAGQKIEEINALGSVTRFTYTSLGQLESITDAKGGILRHEYYPGGNLMRTTLPEGECKTYTYDANGNVSKITDAMGNATTFHYDSLNRITVIGNPLGHSKRLAYNAIGNITEVTDENNHTTQYKYNLLGDIVEVIDAAGHSTKYAYDQNRRLSQVEQYRLIDDALAETLTTNYERNSNGAVTAVHDPMGRKTQYLYDSSGNITTLIAPDGQETFYEYTVSNKLAKTLYADGKAVEYTYNALKQLIEMKDWLGITTLVPDPLGRAEKITAYDGKTTEYKWDELSRRTQTRYPNSSESTDGGVKHGPVVSYAYNQSGNLRTVQTTQGEAHFHYNAMGRLCRINRSNNIMTQYDYNLLGGLERLTHMRAGQDPEAAEILDQFQYTYDPAGRITQIDKYRQDSSGDNGGMEPSKGAFRYAYDPLGRLVSAAHGGNHKDYIYNNLGNRIASRESGKMIFHEYNASNQLIRTQDGEMFEEYRYDERGNLTETTVNGVLKAGYTFDAADMMTHAQSERGRVSYIYDGLKNRVKRLEYFTGSAQQAYSNGQGLPEILQGHSGRETQYVLDRMLPYNNLLQTTVGFLGEQHGQPSTTSHIWANGLYEAEGSQNVSYLTDHLGSPIRLVGAAEEEFAQVPLDYDEFGVPVGTSAIAWNNPFGFTGYQTEDITGLYYAQRRYYDPAISRMISEDPIRSGMNWYMYCGNNPLSYVDPLGLEHVVVSGGPYSETDRQNGNYYYEFIDPALKRLDELSKLNDGETITWLVASDGWTFQDRANLQKTADKYGYDLRFFNSDTDVYRYIDKPGRESDLITDFTSFSHGWQGEVPYHFDYSNNYRGSGTLNRDTVPDLRHAFAAGSISWFYSCNTAAGGDMSFASAWARQTNSTTLAVDGKTVYSGITDGGWWNAIRKNSRYKERGRQGYNDKGSDRYPGLAEGARWMVFFPNGCYEGAPTNIWTLYRLFMQVQSGGPFCEG